MKKESQKFILNIAPLIKLPMSKSQSFSYLGSKSLSPGDLVSVPLFHQKVKGIVLATQKNFKRTGGFELKPIEKIIEKNFLDSKQIKLAHFISEYYFSPLGIVLKSFVPQIAKSKKKKQISNSHLAASIKYQALNKEQKLAIKKITEKNATYLLYGPAGSGKTEVYIHSILNLRKKNSAKQALIILPELTLTPQAIERYSAYFNPEEIVVLNSKLSRGQFFANWQKIKSGEAKIIIATRAGVFAPFKNLGLIVIDEEQDMSHKQWDMNPRYDARTVAQKLSQIHRCPLIFGSATPRIETFYKAQKKEFTLIKIPPLKNIREDIEIVDMRKEYLEKNKFKKNKVSPIISRTLQEKLAEIFPNNQQALLFINRQGAGNFSLCTECKKVIKCPKCDRALSPQNNGQHICLHCSFKTPLFFQCPNCKNMRFESVGIGTQKVEKEIEQLFPQARILRLDNQTAKNKNAQDMIYKKFSSHEADILIGTQMITKGWDLPDLSLIGIIEADSLFSFPDYFTDEKAFQMLAQVSGRTNRPNSIKEGSVVLQTFQPDNKIYHFIRNKDFASFFDKEIKQRKALALTPFGRLLRLVFQDYNEDKVAQETKRIASVLKKELPSLEVSQSQPAFVPKVRGRYRYQIILKLKNKTNSLKLRKVINSLPKGWIIDIDPISIT